MFPKKESRFQKLKHRYFTLPRLRRDLYEIKEHAFLNGGWESESFSVSQVPTPLLDKLGSEGNKLALAEVTRRSTTLSRFAIWWRRNHEQPYQPIPKLNLTHAANMNYRGDEWFQEHYPEFPIPHLEEFYEGYPSPRD